MKTVHVGFLKYFFRPNGSRESVLDAVICSCNFSLDGHKYFQPLEKSKEISVFG